MARMTAQDFVDFTRKRMGNPSTDEWTDAEILRFVNLAQNRVAMTHLNETLETYTDISAVNGTATYEVSATDIIKITSVRDITNGQRLRPTSRFDYTKDTQGATVPTGIPHRYLESGLGANGRRNITLWPTPNSSLTVRIWYIAVPNELVLTPTATSSELPEHWDEVILDYAAEIGMKNDQQAREAQTARGMAAEIEGRASTAQPSAPERRWTMESPIAPETKVR